MLLRTIFPPGSPLDRASLIRHFAIGAAALAAYLLREDLGVGNGVLWILGTALLLNVVTAILSERPRWTRLARILSSLCGIGCWSALVLLTGGTRSPFVAGFGLEIILSAISFHPLGTTLITGGAIAGLWLQESLGEPGPSRWAVVLQTGFLLGTGALTSYVARRWASTHERISAQALELGHRLRSLEDELEDSRRLGRLGEDVARLAHRIKNTAHSLRGFSQLIEPRLVDEDRDREAMSGLRSAIDRLEEIARSTLQPASSVPEGNRMLDGGQVRQVIEEVVGEVGRLHPGVHWVRTPEQVCPAVELPPGFLREILLLLTQNAAEAVGDSGEIHVETRTENGHLQIDVRDDGPGVAPGLRGSLFRPGFTTKPEGSGFGLFLARRLLEFHGGSLTTGTAGDRGAVFSARIPVRRS